MRKKQKVHFYTQEEIDLIKSVPLNISFKERKKQLTKIAKELNRTYDGVAYKHSNLHKGISTTPVVFKEREKQKYKLSSDALHELLFPPDNIVLMYHFRKFAKKYNMPLTSVRNYYYRYSRANGSKKGAYTKIQKDILLNIPKNTSKAEHFRSLAKEWGRTPKSLEKRYYQWKTEREIAQDNITIIEKEIKIDSPTVTHTKTMIPIKINNITFHFPDNKANVSGVQLSW